MKKRQKQSMFNTLTQIFLPIFTILGFLLTAMKKPELGLVFNLVAQVFWIYSTWKAWKTAGQVGLFINSVIITLILVYGVVNYWFL